MGCAELGCLLDISEDGCLWAVVSDSGIRGPFGQFPWSHRQPLAVQDTQGPQEDIITNWSSKDKCVQMGSKGVGYGCVIYQPQV